MELFLQMGHGMMEHCYHLIQHWGTGTVIVSPKNLTLEQILKFSKKISKNNGSILIDPQFYIPRTSQENLHNHSFWPNTFDTTTFFNGDGIDKLIDIFLNEYILPSDSSGIIIPSLYLEDINEDWCNINELIINSLNRYQLVSPKYLTLCIGEEIIKSEEKIHMLIEQVEDYPVDGFYIIPVHPNNEYLIDNMTWLINLIDLVAGLKLLDKRIILGYANHQFLSFAVAKIDAICAGIWLKTRMFPLGDFVADDEDSSFGGRRTTWYYCPQALSEYQIPFLDVAHRVGIIDQLATADSFQSGYPTPLFSGAQPSTVAFNETKAFRHYLQCLKTQCDEINKDSYDETKRYLRLLFETASDLSDYFRSNGVRGKYREFTNVADSTLALIDAFDAMRGLVFNTNWDEL